MKRILLFFIAVFVTSNVSNAQWSEFHTDFPHSLFAVDFVNEHLGYAVGQQGTVLKTTDGAAYWEEVLGVPGVWFTSVYAYNAHIVIAVGSYGSIYWTNDGGMNWVDRSIPFAPSGYHNHFRSVVYDPFIHRYIVIGYDGAYYEVHSALAPIKRTHIQWTMHDIALDPNYVANGRAIIAATDGRLYRTTNHGTSWLFVNIQFTMNIWDYLNSVTYLGENTAIIVGNNGRIIKTHDGGFSWIKYAEGLTMQHLRDVDNVSDGFDNYLVSVGDNGTILASHDNGHNWVQQITNPPTTRHLYGVSLPSHEKGYIVGEIGTYAEAAAFLSDHFSVSISGNTEIVPDAFSLSQNYPNPFNPVTKINFAIPTSELTKLTVFDMTGRTVDVLVNQTLQAGSYEFTFDASTMTSGVYFYRLEAGSFAQTMKMILIK